MRAGNGSLEVTYSVVDKDNKMSTVS